MRKPPEGWADQESALVSHLRKEVSDLRASFKLHAGDTMSLSNELDEWRERALAAEEALASVGNGDMKWQTTRDRPDKFESVLVFVPGSRVGSIQEEPDTMHIAFWKAEWDGLFHLQDDDHSLVRPTHWATLPAAPN